MYLRTRSNAQWETLVQNVNKDATRSRMREFVHLSMAHKYTTPDQITLFITDPALLYHMRQRGFEPIDVPAVRCEKQLRETAGAMLAAHPLGQAFRALANALPENHHGVESQ